jgi:hypothetical protein
LIITNSASRIGQVVDLGGGPRNDKLENPVAYYFHDYAGNGRVTKVVSTKFSDQMRDAAYQPVAGFTGKDVRAANVTDVPFPVLLNPVDDLPPATMITAIRRFGNKLLVKGITQDNGDVAVVTVNGRRAALPEAHAGVVDWELTIESPNDSKVVAHATDKAGNVERLRHEIKK